MPQSSQSLGTDSSARFRDETQRGQVTCPGPSFSICRGLYLMEIMVTRKMSESLVVEIKGKDGILTK